MDLNMVATFPVKEDHPVHANRIMSALWKSGILASMVDVKEEAQMQKFVAHVEVQARSRQEQHEFYQQVKKCYQQSAEAMQSMKREFYREVTLLREQLSRQERDPAFMPDNVQFFDPNAYRVPSWEMLLSELDDRRMKREAMRDEVNRDCGRVKMVPIQMACEHCRSKFATEEEAAAAYSDKFSDMAVQAGIHAITSDAETQTSCSARGSRVKGKARFADDVSVLPDSSRTRRSRNCGEGPGGFAAGAEPECCGQWF